MWLVIRAPLARERRRIGKALDGERAGLEGYLAHAGGNPLLVRAPRPPVTTDPWGDLHSGRHEQLASLELGRLGLTRRAARASLPPASSTPG